MILVGTSGWQYADWRERFYPAGVPQSAWLEHYAARFATVEVNNAFYRLPERETFLRWHNRVPKDFTFAVKISRYLTHIKRLREPAEPVSRFLSRAEALGAKLGPVLLQLPPTLPVNVEALEETLGCFPRGVRLVVEPRHDSWWIPRVRQVLERHNAALCWADRLGRPVTPLWRTADFGYLRLHHGRSHPRPSYGRTALSSWLKRIMAAYPDEPTFVYFNNDQGGAALRDAATFGALAARSGLAVTRTPAPGNGQQRYRHAAHA